LLTPKDPFGDPAARLSKRVIAARDGAAERASAMRSVRLLLVRFLREVHERAKDPDRRAVKQGLRGTTGRKRFFGETVGRASVRKSLGIRRKRVVFGDFVIFSIC
jgi:hypothetical protein